MIEDRNQLITFKKGIKTVKTRIGDGLFSKLITYENGKRKLEIYKYDELLHRMEV